MGRTLGIGEAARYLGISRSELVALYRQDLVPWVGTAELTVGELAYASGVSRGTLYSLLRTLVSEGELTREEPPSGVAGYRLAHT